MRPNMDNWILTSEAIEVEEAAQACIKNIDQGKAELLWEIFTSEVLELQRKQQAKTAAEILYWLSELWTKDVTEACGRLRDLILDNRYGDYAI